MKKLSLQLDQLAVESFETSPPEPGRGTVLGNAPDDGLYGGTFDSTCREIRCGCTYFQGTCDLSCGGGLGCEPSADPQACPTVDGYPGC
jgi:hypothetical protein